MLEMTKSQPSSSLTDRVKPSHRPALRTILGLHHIIDSSNLTW